MKVKHWLDCEAAFWAKHRKLRLTPALIYGYDQSGFWKNEITYILWFAFQVKGPAAPCINRQTSM